MAAELPEQKIKNLYQMLFEMATGNLAFRLETNGKTDGIDILLVLLNQLAGKMQATFLEYGYVSPFYSYQGLVQLTFVLDAEFTIKNYSANTPSILGFEHEALMGMGNINAIIAPASKAFWTTMTNEIRQQPDFHSTIHLVFLTHDNRLLPRFCSVFRLLYSNEIIITSLATILEDLLYDLPKLKSSISPKISEAETMQQLYDYILNRLDEPLPTLKALSRMFKINEFDLKNGFRAYFHNSIHQFYNEHRLKRAHLMIMQTPISLKEIAFMNGFNTYLNFYKAFKKRFGYTPSEISRFQNNNKDDE